MKFLFPLLIILLSACGSTKQKQTDKEPPVVAKPETELVMPTKLPKPGPDQALITAKIIKILPITEDAKKGVCSQYPCMATVQILSVWDKGNSFRPTITPEREISVHFEFSLNPTADLFPELEQALPGLREGDLFETILTGEKPKMVTPAERTPKSDSLLFIYKAYTYNRL